MASIADFGIHNAAYGSLGAAVGVMTRTAICVIFSLLGAELGAEIEHQTARELDALKNRSDDAGPFRHPG